MARGSLSFGIVRTVDASHGRARLSELCALLTDQLGTIFVPHHPDTYAELTERCEKGSLSLAWVPPVACTKLHDKGVATVLALPVRNGAVSYRAALITQNAGPSSLANVKGASIGWVDRESCAGYIVPRLFLSASFDLKSLFGEERFLGSHSAVLDAVVARRVDVGATFCALEGSSSDRTSAFPPPLNPAPAPKGGPSAALPRGPWTSSTGKVSPVRLLAATGPIPNDALVASNELPVDMRTKLLRWFLDLRSDKALRICKELFGADAFRVAAPEHYNPLRRMMQAARAKGQGAS